MQNARLRVPLGMTICDEITGREPESSLSGLNPVFWKVARISSTSLKKTLRSVSFRSVLLWLVIAAVLLWCLAALTLVAAKWIDPPTTAVQMQRRVQSWFSDKPYQKRYKFVPLNQISPELQHAVIAAEDARFYLHHGFDWKQIQIAAKEDVEGERTRGASTLTQQLVKNLLFGTSRSFIRKGSGDDAGAGRRDSSSASGASWSSISTWSSGGRAFTVQRPRAVTTTRFRREVSGENSPPNSLRFCPRRSSANPSACIATPRSF